MCVYERKMEGLESMHALIASCLQQWQVSFANIVKVAAGMQQLYL